MKLRFTAAVLCAFMACSVFAGCGGDKDPVTANTLQIAVVALGYGSDGVRQLAKEFNAQTGKDARVVWAKQDEQFVQTSLQAPRTNKISLYFATGNSVLNWLAQKNFVNGYDLALADLSDVYNASAFGYAESGPGVTYKDLLDPFSTDAFTWTDDKQYAVSYSTSICGLLYNKTLWDETNAKLQAKGAQLLKMPRTTLEMFDLFDYIKTVPSTDRNAAYPYNYSGINDYSTYIFTPWWAQYDGEDAVMNAMQGRLPGETGAYSAQIFNTDGRLHAMETVEKIFKGGYTDPADKGKQFIKAQLDFLKKRAFFACNGDWLENEASEDSGFIAGEVDVRFIQLPVVSEIVNKFPADFTGNKAANDAKLSAVIAGIDDGNGNTQSISQDAFDFIAAARKFNYKDESVDRIAIVPSYAPRVDDAKEFLKFMLSKQGQEIMMKSVYGNMAPLRVDVSQFNYFSQATGLCQSKWALFENSTVFGANHKYPMQYLGGLNFYRYAGNGALSLAFEGKDAAEVRDSEVTHWTGLWDEMMGKAGVSNS